MSPGVMDELRERAGRSVLLRMMFIAFLVLVLQIPILMIDGTVSEREATRQGAIADVTRTWGGAQQVAGPVLTVPYLVRTTDDKGKVTVRTAHAHFLPRELDTTATIATEVRYRGIFQVPLYSLTLTSRGTFTAPDFSIWQVAAADVLWDKAVLAVGVSDPKALRAGTAVRWGSGTSDFRPGRGPGALHEAGIHAPLPGPSAGRDQTVPFAFELSLGGSHTLLFAPLGMETRVGMTAAWPDPSFVGAYLPTSREIGPKGFTARWQIPHLGRNFPQQWLDGQVDAKAITAAAFGVSLLSPVDAYHTIHRAVKYQILFLVLTFVAFYLFELFYARRIHSVQYLLVGSALCLFYLLLLSLSEHVGFARAYAIASAAVVVVIAGYVRAALGGTTRALAIAGMLVALYAFLFVLLHVQDYALLVGSVGLFLVLALLMYATRNVDWYRVGRPAPSD
jgi:inner membrane protein